MRVVISRDVIFIELDMPCLKAKADPVSSTNFPSIRNIPVKVEDTSGHSPEHTLTPEANKENG